MKIAINKLASITSGSVTKLKSSVWEPVWKILTFNPTAEIISAKKSLSVSLDKGTLSVAYGSRFLSHIKIKKVREYFFEENTYPQPESLATSLALAMNDFKAAGADITLSIPKAWVIVKTAEFPATVKENLSDVISYELDRLTPFSSEDAFYDFKVLSEIDGKLSILVLAAKTDLVKPYIDALREMGISINRVTVNLSGAVTLCNYIDKEKGFIYIELDENKYEGALSLNGNITKAFSGIFTAGDDKSKADTVIACIEPILTSDNSRKLKDIMVLLKDKSPSLKELLKTQLNLPVRILNETDIKFSVSGSQEEIPYAAIGGVLESLWPKSNSLNLLTKGHYDTPATPYTLTIILILLIVCMWVLYIIAPLKIEGKKLQEIDRQILLRRDDIKKVEMLKKEIDALSNEISAIDNFKKNTPLTLDIIKELTTTLPKNAWLTRVRIAGPIVNIEGYASSASTLLPKLETSKYFEKAEFSSPTFRDARMNSDRFNIKVEIEGIKKDKGEDFKNE